MRSTVHCLFMVLTFTLKFLICKAVFWTFSYTEAFFALEAQICESSCFQEAHIVRNKFINWHKGERQNTHMEYPLQSNCPFSLWVIWIKECCCFNYLLIKALEEINWMYKSNFKYKLQFTWSKLFLSNINSNLHDLNCFHQICTPTAQIPIFSDGILSNPHGVLVIAKKFKMARTA
jgi:hypothetical protein